MWPFVEGFDIAKNKMAISFALAYAVLVELLYECKRVLVLDSPRNRRVRRVMGNPAKRFEKPDDAEHMTKRLHSFFERVVRNMVRLAEKNVFQLFRPTKEEKEALNKYSQEKYPGKKDPGIAKEGGSPSGNKDEARGDKDNGGSAATKKADAKRENTDDNVVEDVRSKKPIWLQPLNEASFITDEHVHEGWIADDVGGRKPGYYRKLDILNGRIASNEDEIAKFVCAAMFKKSTKILNDSRKAKFRTFFKDIWYLFAS